MAVAKNLSPPPPPRSRFSFEDFLLLLSIDDNETREERINIFIEKAESSILDIAVRSFYCQRIVNVDSKNE